MRSEDFATCPGLNNSNMYRIASPFSTFQRVRCLMVKTRLATKSTNPKIKKIYPISQKVNSTAKQLHDQLRLLYLIHFFSPASPFHKSAPRPLIEYLQYASAKLSSKLDHLRRFLSPVDFPFFFRRTNPPSDCNHPNLPVISQMKRIYQGHEDQTPLPGVGSGQLRGRFEELWNKQNEERTWASCALIHHKKTGWCWVSSKTPKTNDIAEVLPLQAAFLAGVTLIKPLFMHVHVCGDFLCVSVIDSLVISELAYSWAN